MPYSDGRFRQQIKQFLTEMYPRGDEVKILDVGPGAGVWSETLREHFPHMDCIEIFEPYVKQFDLCRKYEQVNLADIRHVAQSHLDPYDIVIMGDILEHLKVSDSIVLLSRLRKSHVIVAVPYRYRQGCCFGNEAECHLQPDLTPALMQERYPVLKPLWIDFDPTIHDRAGIGVYHNRS